MVSSYQVCVAVLPLPGHRRGCGARSHHRGGRLPEAPAARGVRGLSGEIGLGDLSMLLPNWDLQGEFDIMEYEAVCHNLVPLVNIKIAGKWCSSP